jgi:hypothetical protein
MTDNEILPLTPDRWPLRLETEERVIRLFAPRFAD